MIWSQSEIPSTTILPIGDTLFGSFKLLDAHFASPNDPAPSFLDFGFGSDDSRFAGCHRFSIVRNPERGKEDGGGEEEQVEIRLMAFRCNPMKDEDLFAEWIVWFHYCYAKMLFTNGVRACLRGT